MGRQLTAFEILTEVRRVYTGARGHFVLSRLSLRTQINLATISEDDGRPELVEKLVVAVREICPEVELPELGG